MLSENIRSYRKAKGLSQEELAAKLNVVRQTVSKWEKGLSVPDSEMLITLAEALDVSVAALLGEEIPEEDVPTVRALAAKLELLNEQFAKRAERSRRLWRLAFGTVICAAILALILELIPVIAALVGAGATLGGGGSVGIIGGADGPTAIFVTSTLISWPALLVTTLLLVTAILGFSKTK